jgi:hypothetical protein
VLSVRATTSAATAAGRSAHEPVLLPSASAATSLSTKWLVFPTAKTQHANVRQQEQGIEAAIPSSSSITAETQTGTVTEDDFFSTHRDLLALHPSCEMTLSSERRSPSSALGESDTCSAVLHTPTPYNIVLCTRYLIAVLA